MLEQNKNLYINQTNTIRLAMSALDQTAEKCLFVVDEELRLLGSLTDGDVRRAILSGKQLDESVENSFNAHPLSVIRQKEFDQNELIQKARALMKKHKIEVVPVVDAQQHIQGYIRWTDLFDDKGVTAKEPLDVPVVIMAGGFGSRLEPFTKVLPKPLIPVHDKPIIEHIIDKFVEVGAHDFRLTVNYKSRIMKAYFHDRDPDYAVSFIDEPEPLGTAGSLQFLRGSVKDPFFVTNCDIIIDCDYHQVMKFHGEQKNLITLVGSTVHYQIPYGTCQLNSQGYLKELHEKPSFDFLVNTGMYIVDPSVLGLIPAKKVFHMTHLMEAVMAQGGRVGVFPVSEDAWIDVGQWKEYRRVADRLEL